MNLMDSFVDQAGVKLQDHKPDSRNAQWIKHPNLFPVIDAQIFDNRLCNTFSVGSWVNSTYVSSLPVLPDQVIEAEIFCISPEVNSEAALCLRMSETKNTYYSASYIRFATQGFWQITRFLDGKFHEVIGFWREDLYAQDKRMLKFSVKGQNLRLYVEGILRVEVNDSYISQGFLGLYFNRGNKISGFAIDQLRGGDLVLAIAPSPIIFLVYPKADLMIDKKKIKDQLVSNIEVESVECYETTGVI